MHNLEYTVLGVVGLLLLSLIVMQLVKFLREIKERRTALGTLEKSNCHECGETSSQFYVFRNCRCFGIAPLASAWEVNKRETFLCDPCAQRVAIDECKKTGLYGGWGFPGFLAVLFYTIGNIYVLSRNKTANAKTVFWCIVVGVLVPWLVLAIAIVLMVVVIRIWN